MQNRSPDFTLSRKLLKGIFDMAKAGVPEAVDFLHKAYHLRVFTQEEIDLINQKLIEGLTLEEAINQVRKED